MKSVEYVIVILLCSVIIRSNCHLSKIQDAILNTRARVHGEVHKLASVFTGGLSNTFQIGFGAQVGVNHNINTEDTVEVQVNEQYQQPEPNENYRPPNGPPYGNAYGHDHGHGYGHGHGHGNGNGQGNGYGNGCGNGQGNGYGHGYGNGCENSHHHGNSGDPTPNPNYRPEQNTMFHNTPTPTPGYNPNQQYPQNNYNEQSSRPGNDYKPPEPVQNNDNVPGVNPPKVNKNQQDIIQVKPIDNDDTINSGTGSVLPPIKETTKKPNENDEPLFVPLQKEDQDPKRETEAEKDDEDFSIDIRSKDD